MVTFLRCKNLFSSCHDICSQSLLWISLQYYSSSCCQRLLFLRKSPFFFFFRNPARKVWTRKWELVIIIFCEFGFARPLGFIVRNKTSLESVVTVTSPEHCCLLFSSNFFFVIAVKFYSEWEPPESIRRISTSCHNTVGSIKLEETKIHFFLFCPAAILSCCNSISCNWDDKTL